ncbi:sigma-70 family RNA polymerase sigma factor [Sinomonas susongensis]|uniref:sigma-70 family RNA polymerase sigma factor n=1 Tax=Sinomonas susongensis TaxID=1324851 RepID=UPI0011088777|nr:sigma-70 family RNA polymerase sigma factor [Sinomonas susongensis]
MTDLYDLAADEPVELQSTADERGEEDLALKYLGVADALANRHRYPGHDPEDLRQVARLGLMVAIRRYREGAGQGFVPYAVPTITGTIKRYIRDHSWAVRPPRSVQELRLDVNAARRQLIQELGREPSAAELAEVAGVPEEKIAEAQLADAAMVGVSIEPPSAEDSRPDPAARALSVVEPGFEEVESHQLLAAALEGVTEEERRLLHLRFVEEMSQSEIAEILGVSQMQVSRLLKRLLDRMRRKVAA